MLAFTPSAEGVPYAFSTTLSGNDSTSFHIHMGAWSWEDEGIFTPGVDPAVGWTHTSNWLALTQATTLSLTVARDATVPFAGSGNILGMADTDSMFPSLTI